MECVKSNLYHGEPNEGLSLRSLDSQECVEDSKKCDRTASNGPLEEQQSPVKQSGLHIMAKGVVKDHEELSPAAVLEATEPAERRLLVLVETLLGYAQLQVTSEKRCMQETSALRETVTHLRSIFDDGNAEERRHIDALNDVSMTLKALDSQYYEVKEQAKELFVACREDRDHHHGRYKALSDRVHDVETELFSAEAVYSQQESELKALEEASHMHETEGLEISKLRDCVNQLERQNQELEAENQTLERQIFETQAQLETFVKGQRTSEHTTGESDVMTRMIGLQQMIETLRGEALRAKEEFEAVVANEKRLAQRAKERAAELLESYERMKSSVA